MGVVQLSESELRRMSESAGDVTDTVEEMRGVLGQDPGLKLEGFSCADAVGQVSRLWQTKVSDCRGGWSEFSVALGLTATRVVEADTNNAFYFPRPRQ